jgi:hypothetical protein
MFSSQQKHIINKLQVDVATQNPSAAFALKDRLDTFLKQEIFPYLESYFATIEEDLQDQIIQIPYLSVDVNTSSALNYNELKEDVKRALVKNISELTKKAHPQNEEATLLTTAKSKENQFVHFLEKGTQPWWNRSEDSFEVSDEEFETLIGSESFPTLIKKKLMRKVVKKRIIQQLSDQQLKRVWDVLVQEKGSVAISSEAVSLFSTVSSEMRQITWNCLIDFAVQNDIETLVSRLLFALAEEVSKTTSMKVLSKEKSLSSTTPSLQLISNLLMTLLENKRVAKALTLIQKNQNTAATASSQVDQTQVRDRDVNTTKAVGEKNHTHTSELAHKADASESSSQKELQEPDTVKNTITTDSETSSAKISDQKTIQQKKDVEDSTLMNVIEDVDSTDHTVSKQEANNRSFQETKEELAKDSVSSINYNTDARIKDTQELADTKANAETKSDNTKQTSTASDSFENTSEAPKKVSKEKVQRSENLDSKEEQIADSSTDSVAKVPSKKNPKDATSNQGRASSDQENIERGLIDTTQTESETTHQKTDAQKEKEIAELNDSPSAESIKTSSENQSEESVPNASNTHPQKENEEKSEDSVNSAEKATLSAEELTSSLNALVDKQDQKLYKELHKSQLENPTPMEERGEYQISNAGLMMLHPYIKPLFENCDLLNEDNTIKNPDMAVHLLHYVATKKEQQFESNMLFEKILCGVHTSAPIRRNIVLSEEHKKNAEQMLAAVLEHWGVLKNSSPDLLRNEFLQRLGTINFKETNGKIKVERKVQDILLDKLPWGIAICRLPWLDYLLFTDW